MSEPDSKVAAVPAATACTPANNPGGVTEAGIPASVTPPVAAVHPTTRSFHGREFVDNYEWMRDKESPATIAYLEAENAYTEARRAHAAPLQEKIVAEIKARTQETDMSVPSRAGDWWYYGRIEEGKSYGKVCRVPATSTGDRRADWTPPSIDPHNPPADEQIIMDCDALAEGHDFFQVGASTVSAHGRYHAFSVDTNGAERYSLRIRDLTTGELLEDAIEGIAPGATWVGTEWLFYERMDEAWRPCEVWRHRVGTPADQDVCIFREEDERYWVGIGRSRSTRYLYVESSSKITSETWYIDLHPEGSITSPEELEHITYTEQAVTAPLRCVLPREDGVLYDITHAHLPGAQTPDVWIVNHNKHGEDFELGLCPVGEISSLDDIDILLPHQDGRRVEGVDVYSSHMLIGYRDNALCEVAIAPLQCLGGAVGGPLRNAQQTAVGEDSLAASDSAASGSGASGSAAAPQQTVVGGDAALAIAWAPDPNPEGAVLPTNEYPGIGAFRVVPRPEELSVLGAGGATTWWPVFIPMSYESYVTPSQAIDLDLETGEWITRKEQQVNGYDRSEYTSYRTWAQAVDGTRIPISVIHRADLDLTQPRPLVLDGYGSYEISIDPAFSISRLSLMDRGMIVAVAHIRGGGEMGRQWYNLGKGLHKKNTFTDYIAAADHLIELGLTDAQHLVGAGGSAGGLLMGAVANMGGDRFAGISAAVPFVDPLTSMLMPELPLTVTEWDEWGDPLHDPEVYDYMASYAPYENIDPSKPYPAMLVTTSLNDTRVLYVEPAKYVAKLRALVPDADVCLKTEMNAGHGGVSGRYEKWAELAFELAWILEVSGAAPGATVEPAGGGVAAAGE